MLEQDFKKLDYYFVSVWSQYKIEKDKNIIAAEIKELAKQGQLNAMAKWYEFNNVGICPDIDSVAQTLKGESAEELWVMGLFNQRKPNAYQQLEAKVDEYKKLFIQAEQGLPLEQFADIMQQIEDKEKDIKENTYLSYYRKACKLAQSTANKSYTPIFTLCHLAAACEMYKHYAEELPNCHNFIKNRAKIHAHADKLFKSTLKQFKEVHKKIKTTGLEVKRYPQFYFAFANLIMANKKHLSLMDKKLVNFAQEIYQQLIDEGKSLERR